MIVRDFRTLKAMSNRDLIKLHPQTGTKITGLYSSKTFTCYYVDDYGESGCYGFVYNGAEYKLTYMSGCFNPYVEKIGNNP